MSKAKRNRNKRNDKTHREHTIGFYENQVESLLNYLRQSEAESLNVPLIIFEYGELN